METPGEMPVTSLQVGANLVIIVGHFQDLLEALVRQGYQPVGPSLWDGHFIYGPLTGVADLPVGWTDEQEPGAFRLQRREDQALFGYGVGQQSWKQFLFPPRHLLWQARHEDEGFKISPPAEEVPRYAFIGVHACDLAAMAVQDRVFFAGKARGPGLSGPPPGGLRPGGQLWWPGLRRRVLRLQWARSPGHLRLRPGPDRSFTGW